MRREVPEINDNEDKGSLSNHSYFVMAGLPELSLFLANFFAMFFESLLAISASSTSASLLSLSRAAACSAIMDSISAFIPLKASRPKRRFSMLT